MVTFDTDLSPERRAGRAAGSRSDGGNDEQSPEPDIIEALDCQSIFDGMLADFRTRNQNFRPAS